MSMLLGRFIKNSSRSSLTDATCSRNTTPLRNLHHEKPILGRATQRGTTRYGQKPNHHKNRLGFSPFAFELDKDMIEMTKDTGKMEQLVKSGLMNVLEINSTGEADSMAGRLLNRFKINGTVEREELILLSRGGNLDGNMLGLVKYSIQNGRKFNGLKEINKRMWYCIDPEMLEHTITQNIKFLNVEFLDCFLLEVPKYPMDTDEEFEEAMEDFMKSLKPAFEHLEREVDYGRIQTYGISLYHCNTPDRIFSEARFEEMMKIASGIKKHHNFTLIQYPLNMLETLPISLRKYDNNTMTLSELSSKWGLTKLTSRPLEAIDAGKVTHLICEDYKLHDQVALIPKIQSAVSQVIDMEFHYSQMAKGDTSLPPAVEAAWVISLASDPLFAYDNKRYKFFRDNIAEPGVYELTQKLHSNRNHSTWAKDYREKALEVLDLFDDMNDTNSFHKSQEMREALESFEGFKGDSNLSTKALDFLWASKGTDCLILNPKESALVMNQLEPRREVNMSKETWNQLLETVDKMSKDFSNFEDEMKPEEGLVEVKQIQEKNQ